jgi:hypothetical protein
MERAAVAPLHGVTTRHMLVGLTGYRAVGVRHFAGGCGWNTGIE